MTRLFVDLVWLAFAAWFAWALFDLKAQFALAGLRHQARHDRLEDAHAVPHSDVRELDHDLSQVPRDTEGF